MDVDQLWLKHGVISERGTVCWELTIFSARPMPYPYQITIKIIQRVSNNREVKCGHVTRWTNLLMTTC